MTFVRTGIHSIVRFARRAGAAALAVLLAQACPGGAHVPAIAAGEVKAPSGGAAGAFDHFFQKSVEADAEDAVAKL